MSRHVAPLFLSRNRLPSKFGWSLNSKTSPAKPLVSTQTKTEKRSSARLAKASWPPLRQVIGLVCEAERYGSNAACNWSKLSRKGQIAAVYAEGRKPMQWEQKHPDYATNGILGL